MSFLTDKHQKAVFVALSLAGLAVALIAGASEHVGWLGDFCISFGSGCKETAEYVLLHIPLWVWGVIAYLALLFAALRAKQVVFWLVAGVLGVELSLIRIMIAMDSSCIFCLANLAVILLLLVFSFEKARFWKILAVSLSLFIVSSFLILKETESAASVPHARNRNVVATVKGKEITLEELESSIASTIYPLEQEIYRRKQERLEQMITEMLLRDEADRRNIPLRDLIKEVLDGVDLEVTDEELNNFYVANRARWSTWAGTQEELKARLRSFLAQRKRLEALKSYARSLASDDEVTIFLEGPPPPLAHMDLTGSPALGPADAPVTIVEFSDYLCPACRKTHRVIGKIREIYQGKIRWVFKDFPLRRHKWARQAAEAARCADEQGKFWEYQEILFSSEKELNPSQLKQYAKDLGMDEDQFEQCLSTHRYKEAVEKDIEIGKKAGVIATPTFVINGVPVSGMVTLEDFKKRIDWEIEKQSRAQELAGVSHGKFGDGHR